MKLHAAFLAMLLAAGSSFALAQTAGEPSAPSSPDNQNTTQPAAPSQSDQGQVNQSNPSQTTPDQSNPNQTTPSQTTPDQTTPSQTTPSQTTPDQTSPNQNTPNTGEQNTAKPMSNDEIAGQVSQAISKDSSVGGPVRVQVKGNRLILSGTVHDMKQRKRAEEVASQYTAQNNLKLVNHINVDPSAP